MDLCEICKERKHCREICPELNKEISARGVSPRQKDKTYSVDMSYLEENKNPLNEFQQEVARKLVRDSWESFFTQLDFVEVIDKVLLPREKLIIQLILEGYTQEGLLRNTQFSKNLRNCSAPQRREACVEHCPKTSKKPFRNSPQEEIGRKLRIVKSRVNFLLQRAKGKIKIFYLGG